MGAILSCVMTNEPAYHQLLVPEDDGRSDFLQMMITRADLELRENAEQRHDAYPSVQYLPRTTKADLFETGFENMGGEKND
jgi:hypothetical protein